MMEYIVLVGSCLFYNIRSELFVYPCVGFEYLCQNL